MGIAKPSNLKNYQAAEKDSYTNSLLQAGVYESGAQSPGKIFPLNLLATKAF
jgi:hypothetical protein